jgi:hypothetical protein
MPIGPQSRPPAKVSYGQLVVCRQRALMTLISGQRTAQCVLINVY